MSWLFSRALVEEYSAANCSDGEPSAQLNENPTPQAYLSPDRMTAFSRLFRFGMTFAPLTGARGEELLMSFLAGFPAKTLAPQEKAQESTANDLACGRTWPESSARYDRVTHSWRTHQCLWDEALPESSVTLPKWGMARDGVVSPLPTLARRTRESVFGFWATPTTMDRLPPKSPEALLREATIARPGRSKPANLRDQVSNAHRWPTPTVNGNYNRKGLSKNSGDGLAAVVKRYATPQSRDFRTGETKRWNDPARSRNLNDQIGGQLNPTWVEWLMGWLLGWTELKPLETDKFLSWQQQHGGCFLNDSTIEVK